MAAFFLDERCFVLACFIFFILMETEQAISGTSDATYKVMTLIVTTECDCKNEKSFQDQNKSFHTGCRMCISNIQFPDLKKQPILGPMMKPYLLLALALRGGMALLKFWFKCQYRGCVLGTSFFPSNVLRNFNILVFKP